MSKTVSLELHDFSILRSRMDLLLQIKEHYPNFKVTLFTIPFDYEYEMSPLRVLKDDAKKQIAANLDWMMFVPHGGLHTFGEFAKADKHTMTMYLDSIGMEFAAQGFPCEPGFCAPNWLWTEGVVEALNERGWWGAVDRNQPEMLRTKKYYEYTHSIDEPFWESPDERLALHGHMTPPSSNNIDACFRNILKLPTDTEWVYATDFLKEDNG